MARGQVVSIYRAAEFVTEECCKCGVEFAVTASLQKHWRTTKQSFYCPNGHGQSYTQSETERVRLEMQGEIDKANAAAARAATDAEWWRVRTAAKDRKLSAAKGQMTKLRKRVGNGVCPCCNRTFKQLSAHMAHKHPEYKQPEPEVDQPA